MKSFLLVTLLLFPGMLTGCQGNSGGSSSAQGTGSGTPAPPTQTASPITGPAFNASEAYGFLTDQCHFGVRKPNTTGHDLCKAYLLKQLTPSVDKVVTQNFTFRDDARNVTLNLTNILGIINPTATKKVMLFTHWDTRPTADNDLTPANRTKPIIGADDGASGTAVLLELARLFHKQHPTIGVELLFVDGEDWGPGDDKMYLGARHFAAAPGIYKPDYAILLDMIGDKDLNIYREITSENVHPELNDKVWNTAAALGDGQYFINHTKWQITDDHDSFNAVGIPAIDLIDFDYPYWHTLQDTADKCSGKSLKIVGDVMESVIYNEPAQSSTSSIKL